MTTSTTRCHPLCSVRISNQCQPSTPLFIHSQVLWFHSRTDLVVLPNLSKRQVVNEGVGKHSIQCHYCQCISNCHAFFQVAFLWFARANFINFAPWLTVHSVLDTVQLVLVATSIYYYTIVWQGDIEMSSRVSKYVISHMRFCSCSIQFN